MLTRGEPGTSVNDAVALRSTRKVYPAAAEDGSKAVGIFNTSDKYQTIALNRNENDLSGYSKIRDVWQQKYLISIGSNFVTKVAPHGVVLVKMSK